MWIHMLLKHRDAAIHVPPPKCSRTCPAMRATRTLHLHRKACTKHRFRCHAHLTRRIAFSPDGMELWAVAEPNRLDRYELFEGQLLQQVSGAHRLDIQSLAVDPAGRFVVTGGNDALVKVWAAAPRSLPRAALQAQVPAHQAFSGHPSAVLGACDVRGLDGWGVGGYVLFVWGTTT